IPNHGQFTAVTACFNEAIDANSLRNASMQLNRSAQRPSSSIAALSWEMKAVSAGGADCSGVDGPDASTLSGNSIKPARSAFTFGLRGDLSIAVGSAPRSIHTSGAESPAAASIS